MDNKIEIWKDIDGYEDMYQVSNMGRVRSLDRVKPNSGGQIVKGHTLPNYDNGHGYLWVTLWKFNKGKHIYVHRLVASAFIPNPNNFPIINHKDEDKSNNKASNLEWCTQKYNVNYGNHMKNLKESYIANGNNRAIDAYDKNGMFLKTFDCSNEVCKELGVNRRELYLTCHGVTKGCRGFRFAFHGDSLKPYVDKCKKAVSVHILQYDSEGYLSACYDSMKEAERANNLYRGFLRVHNIKHNGNIVKGGYRYVLA